MAFVWIMTPDHLEMAIDTMPLDELLGQVGWARSYLKAASYENYDDFLASQHAEFENLTNRVQIARVELHSLSIEEERLDKEYHDVVATWSTKKTDEPITLSAQLQADAEQSAELEISGQLVKAVEKPTKDFLALFDAARRACSDHASLIYLQRLQIDHLNDRRILVSEMRQKVLRMMSLEDEFKKRNDLARTCAEYHAWTLQKESTFVEPEIPKYTYVHEDLADASILPSYTPDFSTHDVSWFW